MRAHLKHKAGSGPGVACLQQVLMMRSAFRFSLSGEGKAIIERYYDVVAGTLDAPSTRTTRDLAPADAELMV